ncbi:GNAT family N-acetyltransferase [Streptomyces sp. NPDC007988]|uniref:GNAT family N-acetyltransferase n=1 Tax=Streptomyces sp. NPDC007988 TaxID=3364802 RepID=UPI0036E9DCCA
MSVEVSVVREANDESVEAFARLLPQLSNAAGPLHREAVGRLLTGDATTVLLARVEGEVVGMLTLVMFPLLSGLRARVEDVVVDEAARGHGVGGALTEEALRLAEAAGARTVDLTSRPSREAANRLYERLGFEARNSTVYRFVLRRWVEPHTAEGSVARLQAAAAP